MIDQEDFQAGDAILRRKNHQRETADLTHHLDDEIKRAHSEQRRERGEPGGVGVLTLR